MGWWQERKNIHIALEREISMSVGRIRWYWAQVALGDPLGYLRDPWAGLERT